MRKAFLEITEAAALQKTDSAKSIDTTTDPTPDEAPKINEKIAPKCNFKILDLELVRQYLLEFGVDLTQANPNNKPSQKQIQDITTHVLQNKSNVDEQANAQT